MWKQTNCLLAFLDEVFTRVPNGLLEQPTLTGIWMLCQVQKWASNRMLFYRKEDKHDYESLVEEKTYCNNKDMLSNIWPVHLMVTNSHKKHSENYKVFFCMSH